MQFLFMILGFTKIFLQRDWKDKNEISFESEKLDIIALQNLHQKALTVLGIEVQKWRSSFENVISTPLYC